MAATPIQSQGGIRHVSANQATLFPRSQATPFHERPSAAQGPDLGVEILGGPENPTAEGVAFVVTRGDPEQFRSGPRASSAPLHAMPGDGTKSFNPARTKCRSSAPRGSGRRRPGSGSPAWPARRRPGHPVALYWVCGVQTGEHTRRRGPGWRGDLAAVAIHLSRVSDAGSCQHQPSRDGAAPNQTLHDLCSSLFKGPTWPAAAKLLLVVRSVRRMASNAVLPQAWLRGR